MYRRAHYYCMLALMRHGDDPEPVLVEGRWDGTIIDLPRGGGGCPSTINFVMRKRVSGRPSEKLALLTPGSA